MTLKQFLKNNIAHNIKFTYFKNTDVISCSVEDFLNKPVCDLALFSCHIAFSTIAGNQVATVLGYSFEIIKKQ